MEKIYVGQLHMAHRVSNADVTEKTELRAANKKLRAENETLKKSALLVSPNMSLSGTGAQDS